MGTSCRPFWSVSAFIIEFIVLSALIATGLAVGSQDPRDDDVNLPREPLAAIGAGSVTDTPLPSPTNTPIPGAWLDKAPIPTSISDGCAVKDGQYVYVMINSNLFRYDTVADNWTTLPPIPADLGGARCVTTGGNIYVPGGLNSAGNGVGTLYIYNIASNAWSTGAIAPTGRAAYGIADIGGKIYRVGGCSGDTCYIVSNELRIYDIATDTWSTGANYPTNISFHMCGAIDGFIYCVGGSSGLTFVTGKGYRYDPIGNVWSDADMADFPVGPGNPLGTIYAAGTGVDGGQMAVFGGMINGFDTTNRTWRFMPDAGGGLWSEFQPMNHAVYDLAGTAGSGSLYAEGGIEGSVPSSYNQVWTAGSQIVTLTPSPSPTTTPTATVTATPVYWLYLPVILR